MPPLQRFLPARGEGALRKVDAPFQLAAIARRVKNRRQDRSQRRGSYGYF
jgi:hypothetical protein